MPNKSHQQSSIKDVFLNAREKPLGKERDEFLCSAVGSDTPLRRRVDRMLAAAERSQPSELDIIAEDVAPPTVDRQAWQVDAEADYRRIGPYHVAYKLGEGGMGDVFVAQQREPIRRTVAVKLIRRGMDTKEVIARFESERQALSLMNHPNIAKVLDAGETDDGRPFFVMELIRGIPITEYCDKHKLSMTQRLRLFIDVCQAVHHAHQKGIIHRDVKPSNVLVELHDVRHVPKVIDFGVAKATNQNLTNRTLVTQLSHMIGTPLYMSPEQAELSGLDVDTRSDVYSLGVLLYELITGTAPFDAETLRKAGFDEMRRIIREEEPPRPSDRISTLKAEEISTLAERNQMAAPRLKQITEGELDWIVMKALEKDRTRRYDSAGNLATDVQRYLDGEVVQACPPSNAYRMRKFARKHKLVLTSAGLILLAIVSGSGVALWQTFHALDAKKQADSQRERAEANLSLALNALDETYMKPGIISDEEMSDEERKHLSKGLAFYESFAKQNAASNEARWEAGKSYYRVSQIHHIMGQDKLSEQALLRSLAIFDALATTESDESIWQANRAVVNEAMGWRMLYQSRPEEAHKYHTNAVSICKAITAEMPNNLVYQADLARCTKSLAFSSNEQEKAQLLQEALTFYEQPQRVQKAMNATEEDVRRLLFYDGEVNAKQEIRLAQATTYAGMGHYYREADEFNRAREYYVNAAESQLSLLKHLPRSRSLWKRLRLSYDSIVSTSRSANQYDETEQLLLSIIDLASRQLSPDDHEVNRVKVRLADVYRSQGRFHDAVDLYVPTLEQLRSSRGETGPLVLEIRNNLGLSYTRCGEFDKAEALLREQLEVIQSKFDRNHELCLAALEQLASILRDRGQHEDSQKLYQECFDIRRDSQSPEHPDALAAAYNVAMSLFYRGQFQEAESLHRETLEVLRRHHGEKLPLTLQCLYGLALSVRSQERFAEAETLWRELIADAKSTWGDHNEWMMKAKNELASSLRNQGRLVEEEAVIIENLMHQLEATGENGATRMRSISVQRLRDCWTEQLMRAEDRDAVNRLRERSLAFLNQVVESGHELGLVFSAFEPILKTSDADSGQQDARRHLLSDKFAEYFASSDRDDSQFHTWKGVWHQSLGDTELAIAELRKAQKQSPSESIQRQLVLIHIQHGKAKSAIEDLPNLDELEATTEYLRNGSLTAYAGNESLYRQLCERMLEKFARSRNIVDLDRTCKLCALTPGVIETSRLPLDSLEELLQDDNDDEWRFWKVLAVAIARYRMNEPEDSLSLIREAQEQIRFRTSPDAQAFALALTAMCEHDLGNQKRAEHALREATKTIEAHWPKLLEDDFGNGWPDWLIAKVLWREAAALLSKNDI